MIESKLVSEDVEEEIKYPVLMINRDKDLVVWFECSKEGTVVYTTNEDFDIWESLQTWDMSRFTKYKGEVILSNK